MKNQVKFYSGEYQFHPIANFNYQLNRTYTISNGDIDEIAELAKKITGVKSWEKEMLLLAEKALNEGRIENASAYYRMAEFFMYDGNPEKLKVYEKSQALFYEYHSELFKSGILKQEKIPYMNGYIPVVYTIPDGECKDVILLHGGFDSYMEESIPSLLYLREKGFAVYLFEGPGQGEVLRRQKVTFTIEWEKPVKAILDHFQLNEVTIIGVSLGSILAPRAAAFESRIKRIVAWSVCTNQLELLLDATPEKLKKLFMFLLRHKCKRIINNMMYAQMKKDSGVDWGLHHGMYNMGVETPYDFMVKANKYEYKNVADRITQDFMLIGAEKDHLISIEKYKTVIDSLKNVKSLTYRLYTAKEKAASHCSIGNTKLVLDTIAAWIDVIKNRVD